MADLPVLRGASYTERAEQEEEEEETTLDAAHPGAVCLCTRERARQSNWMSLQEDTSRGTAAYG